jgi:hypothetical protein
MGILLFFGTFFLISLVFGLIFSLILMNLRIIEIPPKYAWLNGLIFIKRNALLTPPNEARKDPHSQPYKVYFGAEGKMSTNVSGSITITFSSYPLTAATTTTLPLEAIPAQETVIETAIVRPDYFGEEATLLSANRESNERKLLPARKPSDFQGGYFSQGRVHANEANC